MTTSGEIPGLQNQSRVPPAPVGLGNVGDPSPALQTRLRGRIPTFPKALLENPGWDQLYPGELRPPPQDFLENSKVFPRVLLNL